MQISSEDYSHLFVGYSVLHLMQLKKYQNSNSPKGLKVFHLRPTHIADLPDCLLIENRCRSQAMVSPHDFLFLIRWTLLDVVATFRYVAEWEP